MLPIAEAQRGTPGRSIEAIAPEYDDRNEENATAYATGAYGYRETGDYFHIRLAKVGRIVRAQMSKFHVRHRTFEKSKLPVSDGQA